jgi:hypothetical protein
MIHPLVRDLYKRVVIVSKDYPSTDSQHIKQLWKTAIRNPDNCPSWYHYNNHNDDDVHYDDDIHDDATRTKEININNNDNDVNELYHAVHRGRQMVKEMIGIVQLHKYRTMKQRYNSDTEKSATTTITTAAKELFIQYNNNTTNKATTASTAAATAGTTPTMATNQAKS